MNIKTLFIALLLSNAALAQDSYTGKDMNTSTQVNHALTMTITNLETPTGKIALRLLDQNESVIAQQYVAVDGAEVTAQFEDVAPGQYAIQYYHDANDNDELDTMIFGIPTEGYGNSNDVKGMFGPPAFADQLFDLTGDMEMVMKTIN